MGEMFKPRCHGLNCESQSLIEAHILPRAFGRAFRGGYRSLARATFEWGLRAGIGLGLIVLGGAASQALSARGGLALVGLFAIHQAIVLARAGLRTSWLACALRRVAD